MLAVRFAVEFGYVYRQVRRVGGRWRDATAPAPLGRIGGLVEEARAGAAGDDRRERVEAVLAALRSRTHTLRAVVTILPVLGFFGTVAGLSNSLVGSSGVSSESAEERQAALQAMEVALATAFDKSLLAFAVTIVCIAADRWLRWKLEGLTESLRSPPGPATPSST